MLRAWFIAHGLGLDLALCALQQEPAGHSYYDYAGGGVVHLASGAWLERLSCKTRCGRLSLVIQMASPPSRDPIMRSPCLDFKCNLRFFMHQS